MLHLGHRSGRIQSAILDNLSAMKIKTIYESSPSSRIRAHPTQRTCRFFYIECSLRDRALGFLRRPLPSTLPLASLSRVTCKNFLSAASFLACAGSSDAPLRTNNGSWLRITISCSHRCELDSFRFNRFNLFWGCLAPGSSTFTPMGSTLADALEAPESGGGAGLDSNDTRFRFRFGGGDACEAVAAGA